MNKTSESSSFKKVQISWKEVRDMVKELNAKISWYKISNIYGIPRGGQYVALMLSEISDIPITNEIADNTLIVDDIVDSGNTLARFHGKGCGVATLHVKPHSMVKPRFWVKETSDYIIYPWESASNETVDDNIRRILQFLGIYKVEDKQLLLLKGSLIKFIKDWGHINGLI